MSKLDDNTEYGLYDPANNMIRTHADITAEIYEQKENDGYSGDSS